MIKRSLSVTILGGIFIVLGGISILALVYELIIWVATYGLGSIGISSIWSLKGFVTHGVFPVTVYSLGIGILLQRPWARRCILFIFPLLVFFFIINEYNYLPWIFIVGYLIYFFNRKDVKRQFGGPI